MKKNILTILIFLLLSSPSFAFIYGIKILPKEDIQKLPDSQLYEAYVDAKIEEQVSREFHYVAGFINEREVRSRKNLLRYIFDLRMEMSRRKTLKPNEIDGILR